jgi:cytoskeletal protein RodZ
MTLQLKEARIQAGYSVEMVARELNIRKRYLQALEDEDYHILPGQVYIDGYKKIYAKYLGISLITDEVAKEDQLLLQNKLVNNEKFKKYLVAISVMMLILIVAIYQLILQSDLNTSETLQPESSNYKNASSYNNERDQ